jgi:ribosomal protein S18 acetylase RimI-like enzyme
MRPDPFLQPLEFESGVFGRPVHRCTVTGDCSESELRASTARWLEAGTWLVSCRIGDEGPSDIVLKAAGFHPVETLITFCREVPDDAAMPDGIEPATDADAQACIAIGRLAFRLDRFHSDLRLDNTDAEELKARWVANSFAGRADAILVARQDDAVLGFVLCCRTGPTALIDLIAVADRARGDGIGRKLVEGALAYYAGRVETMTVGTQNTNGPSTALYRAAGFSETRRERTYHWLNELHSS